jgi:Transposase DNA-binding
MPVATRCRWEEELAGSTFADARLEQRLHRLVGQMDRSLGASLPFACQDWASTKAAYRFFSNERVSEAQILSGHFASTRERVRASDGPILVLQDTTEFTLSTPIEV